MARSAGIASTITCPWWKKQMSQKLLVQMRCRILSQHANKTWLSFDNFPVHHVNFAAVVWHEKLTHLTESSTVLWPTGLSLGLFAGANTPSSLFRALDMNESMSINVQHQRSCDKKSTTFLARATSTSTWLIRPTEASNLSTSSTFLLLGNSQSPWMDGKILLVFLKTLSWRRHKRDTVPQN